ncbi:hypothetical protein MRS44_015696 [Fusarium solani]|uniref:uncharacterized protein n=1 Tax=Fusarium solani TaxID=169388 RepID=UPI0032C43834|nr:hypothetical protein MRS44_015696 [Fusarium solani]
MSVGGFLGGLGRILSCVTLFYSSWFRAKANPCISGFYEHLQGESHAASKIVYLDYPHNEPSQFEPTPVAAVEDDLSHVVNGITPYTTRFLFVENINSMVISKLGESLDIDPIFFADYIHSRGEHLPKAVSPPSLATLPSLIATRSHIHLHHYQFVSLKITGGRFSTSQMFKTDSNVPRNVRLLAPISGTQLARVRACCSFMIKTVNSSRICLFLVDPPINSVKILETTSNKSYEALVLHGGFEDFQSPPLFSSFIHGKISRSVNKSSILDCIIRYLQTQPPPGFLSRSPSILSVGYYPIRIVLAEWNFYTHLICRMQYSIRNKRRLCDEDIVDLQRWRRRSKKNQQRLDTLAEVIIYHMDHEDDKEPWMDILKDTNWLRAQLQDYCQSFEQIVTVSTSLVQLLDSRQSILEAVNMRRLTYIALVFMPLAWVASLFSMSDAYSPGHELFWVYFATSLPLLAIVLLLSALPLAQEP